MSVGRIARLCLFSTLGSLALALTGCAFSGGPTAARVTPPAAGGGSTSGSSAAKAGLGGRVFGGQQAITGAAVTLWSAGVAGPYGTGATSIATTTTDSNGSFTFDNNVTGLSPCTPGQYLYITAVGGNTGGGTNQYAALMAALPTPCTAGTGPGTTAGTSVVVNEVTTVASVTALQQFMSISPGNTPAWSIGAPAANVTGLANAFTQVGNLVSIPTGTSAATTATNTINSVVYSTTITPDTAKIYAFADVLASCINTTGAGTGVGTCSGLFGDATPGSSTAPTDTIQVAYYLATNAAGLTMPAHGTAGSPSWLCSSYITAGAPFQINGNPPTCNDTTTGTYPTDWAIGVSWATSNGSTTIGTANTYSLAIDGNGNVWTAHSVVSGSDTTAANITAFNPAGQVQFTPVSSATITTGPTTQLTGGTPVSYTTTSTGNFTGTLSGSTSPTVNVLGGRGNDLAIDTNNNAWFNAYNTAAPATSGGFQGLLTEVTQTGTPTGVLIPALVPGVIAIDGNNNIYIDDEPATSGGTARYYTSELEFSNATHTGAYAVFNEGIDRQTATEEVVWTDSAGYVWSVASSGKCTPSSTAIIYRGNTADLEADGASGNSTHDVTFPSTGTMGCPLWGGFSDGSGGAYFTQNGSFGTNGLYHVAVGSVSPYVGTFGQEAAGTGTTNGGLDGPTGVIVDGLGDTWVANSAGGVSEFSFATGAFVPLSPSGTSVYGFGSSYLTGKNPYTVAADSSGNLWIGSSDSALHYLVGVAGPVITPVSAMLKAGFVGQRPGAPTQASLTSTLTFSTLTTGSQQQTATLTNTGTASVNNLQISISGTNQSDFTVSNKTCGSTLAIGANCTITVTFTSATAGTFSAALNVASNAVGSPATATLSGTASASAGTVNVQPGVVPPTGPALSFGPVVAPTATTPQAVVLMNTGATTMNLALAMTGSGATLFPETTTCGSTLAAGANCFVSFTFGPKVAGSYSAALSVTNDAGTGQGASLSGTATAFTITVNTSSSSGWAINNGAISFSWNATSGNLTSWILDGTTDQLVDTTTTTNGQPYGLYMDNTGSLDNASVPSGTGVAATPVAACTIVGGTQVGTQTTPCTVGSGPTPYLDWSLAVPDSANSGNAYTFVEHWIVFANDPGVHTYVELVHSTSDATASVGQIQWVFRDNLATFTNTYSVNAGLGIPGVQDIPQPPVADTSSSDPGRAVQNAAEDLHGFNNLPSGFTRQFFTKYDYAGYEYLHQGQGVYGTASSGTTYGIWTVMPKLETLVGGPTKQDLYFTNNIDMIEAYSDHENEALDSLGLSTASGVAFNRLFGPFYIHVNTLGTAYNQNGTQLATQADLYADAISAESALVSNYDNDAQLVAAGYVPSTGRGSVSIQVNGISGLPLPQYTAWAVLSDPGKNFQVSTNGMQYWADISNNGTATITGVAPGTYRLSVYVLGQWGEYRQDGIVVTANTTTTVPTVTFQPENFAGVTGSTVFTIGTPDRSAHEFLHGHSSNGNDDREFYGNWNYWMDFAANNGAVVYYATADGSNPATNNLNLWNYNHWGTSFDPGLYDPNTATPPAGGTPIPDNTYGYDDYSTPFGNSIPTYVAGLSGASGTNGVLTGIPAWQVHFATPANVSSMAYAVLSVAIACDEGSYVVALNGNTYTWSRTNESDCMVRSGLSGYTQWFVMQWPTSDLNQTVGGDNVITIGMSQPDGASDDALRLELTNTSAAQSSSGWNDYTFLNGSTTLNNDTVSNP